LELLLVLAAALLACAPNVAIQSTRNSAAPGTIEPVAVIIYERNTGNQYTEPLKQYLTQEFKARRIPARIEIVTGAEFDEVAVVKRTAAGARGIIFIIPVGGTSYYGSLKQILYEINAFRITNHETGELLKVWHARVDTSSGAFEGQIEDRLELFAQDLVTRLVQDRVLPAQWSPRPAQQQPSKPRPRRESAARPPEPAQDSAAPPAPTNDAGATTEPVLEE
jgi:hypothetical protein